MRKNFDQTCDIVHSYFVKTSCLIKEIEANHKLMKNTSEKNLKSVLRKPGTDQLVLIIVL